MRQLLARVTGRFRRGHMTVRTTLRIVVSVVVLGLIAAIGIHVFSDRESFVANLFSNLMAILATVFIIDQLGNLSAAKRERYSLILQLGSSNQSIATEAARLLRSRGWHDDGSLIRARLVSADLRGAHLYTFNLSRALLYDADLRTADLYRATLDGAILKRAKLAGATLEGASLRGADLSHAILDGASLIGADIRGADITNASFAGADITDITADESQLSMISRSRDRGDQHATVSIGDGGDYQPRSPSENFAADRVFTAATDGARAMSVMNTDDVLRELLAEAVRALPQRADINEIQARRTAFILISEGSTTRVVALDDDTYTDLRTSHDEMAKTSDPLAAFDASQVPSEFARNDEPRKRPPVSWARSAIEAPIRVGHAVMGTINMVSEAHRDFRPADVLVLQMLGEFAATALARERFHRMTITLFKQVSKDGLLDTILREAAYFLSVSQGGFYEYKPEKQQLELVAVLGQPEAKGNVLAIGEGLAGYLVKQGLEDSQIKFKIVDTYATWDGRSAKYGKDRKFDAVLGVLLRRRDGSIIGSFSLDCEVARGWTNADAKFLSSFAEYVELAYEQFDVISRLQQTRDAARDIGALDFGELTRNDLLLSIAKRIQSAVDQDLAILVVFGDEGAQWVSTTQFAEEGTNILSIPIGDSLLSDAGWISHVTVFENPDRVPFHGDESRLAAHISRCCVSRLAMSPLRTPGRYVGVLLVGSRAGKRELDTNDTEGLALLGNQAAATIEYHTALEEKRRYLYTAAHELREPVERQLGALEILATSAFSISEGDRSQWLKVAIEASRDQEDLIRQFLDLGLIDAAKLFPASAPVDIVKLANTVVEAITPAATTRNLKITLATPKEPLVVDADRDRLRLSFINVMRNAVQFATHSVQVRVVASEDDVIISVEDDGPGIPTGEQSAIFRRYYRGKRAVAGIRGTGLGLYLAKEWLTLQGGTIDVDSVEGRGSTFNIRMPCKARAGSEGTSNA